MRPGDQHPEAAPEKISHDPRFVWPGGVLAARDDGSLDALAAVGGDAVDVEGGEGA
jgi:hypothetical protein